MNTRLMRHAVVTGGAGDIGGAIVARLSADGFATTIVDTMDEDAGAIRARELCAGAPVKFRHASTTSREALTAVMAELPQVDLAVMCAGTVRAQPFLYIDDEVWALHLAVNLTGAFLAAQVAARRMVQDSTRGHLIFISSWVASRPWPEIAAYSSSKAGVDQLMRQVALELAPQGIRANSVAPGIVMAGLAKTQFETEPQYAARASRAIPLGAPQTADQIADAVGFLASSAAATMTGSILTVDAGATLGSPA